MGKPNESLYQTDVLRFIDEATTADLLLLVKAGKNQELPIAFRLGACSKLAKLFAGQPEVLFQHARVKDDNIDLVNEVDPFSPGELPFFGRAEIGRACVAGLEKSENTEKLQEIFSHPAYATSTQVDAAHAFVRLSSEKKQVAIFDELAAKKDLRMEVKAIFSMASVIHDGVGKEKAAFPMRPGVPQKTNATPRKI